MVRQAWRDHVRRPLGRPRCRWARSSGHDTRRAEDARTRAVADAGLDREHPPGGGRSGSERRGRRTRARLGQATAPSARRSGTKPLDPPASGPDSPAQAPSGGVRAPPPGGAGGGGQVVGRAAGPAAEPVGSGGGQAVSDAAERSGLGIETIGPYVLTSGLSRTRAASSPGSAHGAGEVSRPRYPHPCRCLATLRSRRGGAGTDAAWCRSGARTTRAAISERRHRRERGRRGRPRRGASAPRPKPTRRPSPGGTARAASGRRRPRARWA